jgi:peptidoglycan/xylan/chitin deacetylase (PgdA/CDA1 family)
LGRNMNSLMIHDIRRDYFDLDLAQYRLTFDDGLFSQYYYYPLFRRYGTEMIFFIVPWLVGSGKARQMFSGEHLDYVKSKKYMYETFIEGSRDRMMNLEEIRVLAAMENVRIGAHSYFHDVIIIRGPAGRRKPVGDWKRERVSLPVALERQLDLSVRSRLAFQGYEYVRGELVERSPGEWLDYIRSDTEQCLEWFAGNLGFTPSLYCFPFNEYSETLLRELRSYGFTQFYGRRGQRGLGILPREDIDALPDKQPKIR